MGLADRWTTCSGYAAAAVSEIERARSLAGFGESEIGTRTARRIAAGMLSDQAEALLAAGHGRDAARAAGAAALLGRRVA